MRRKGGSSNFSDRLSNWLLWLLTAVIVILTLLVAVKVRNFKRQVKIDNSAAAYQVHGIDISHHQPSIDWDKVCAVRLHGEPISFVFAKCSEGRSKTDETYRRNKKAAHQHKIKFGAYHFFVPGIPTHEQAQNFIRHADLCEGDLVPVLDVEVIGRLGRQQLIEDVLQWLKIVGKHYDCMPILYTGISFRNRYLNDERISHYPFWKAHYQSKQMVTGKSWTFCQYTHRGHVDGIKDGKYNYVDLNVFRGMPEDLEALTISRKSD